MAALLVVAGLASTSRPRREKAPNIVFVLVDTLRADRVRAYGSRGGARTPVMDALAREGIVFERAYAPSSWTVPSVASLFLGQPASKHHVLQFLVALPRGSPTLAEVLAHHGYDTAAFVANPALTRIMGYERGFREFALLESPELAKDSFANARLFAWLDGRAPADRPLFLYLHYMDPHAPYQSRPGFTPSRQPGVELADRDLTMRP
jgi:membrane-anchored protein YejM (alkaline phosphatase superfamily)